MLRPHRTPILLRLGVAALALLTLSGCGSKYIEGTDIEDTKRNRELLRVVETYRRAVETRDIEILQGLLSSRYYENASTTGIDSDDYGPDEMLVNVLPMLAENVDTVFYQVKVTQIRGKGAAAAVDYEFVLKFRFSDGVETRWALKSDVNQLELSQEHGAWKIVAGM